MKSLFAGLLLSVLAAGPALAQSQSVRANIPFAFTAGQKSLPAGSYTLKSMAGNGVVLGVRSDGGMNAIAISHSVDSLRPSDTTKLVFRRYDGEYCLSQIWVAGEKIGRELPITTRERKLADSHPPLRVTVLAQLVSGK
jgi:hypothetical protein